MFDSNPINSLLYLQPHFLVMGPSWVPLEFRCWDHHQRTLCICYWLVKSLETPKWPNLYLQEIERQIWAQIHLRFSLQLACFALPNTRDQIFLSLKMISPFYIVFILLFLSIWIYCQISELSEEATSTCSSKYIRLNWLNQKYRG